ncbi:NRAMP family divalent metal transporter [Paraburkholderia bryophila]|uniref:NRAMP (Natural resistance-associated macrophage protein)-like metal ion transporter n=1 Tax=Paraburkholderia bryophila TaxID=420952 RepID=A0A7Z0BCB4_9BURK|nr:NRAMP family divalent metal transporter [Paraburkholderia bryophila]NYH27352.1 NRAMP (natural resistance-associated macrophage protein)-like metal ion transporter [Paraburkholderia bryophila]
MSTPINVSPPRSAVLDEAHIGDIKGALGTIAHHDTAPRNTWWARFRTLLAILGPGLIVMVGDNDAGAFGTYTQAGQNYGTTLLWTMLLLVPVLFVNQEMVLRLGAVTGVGHARLIFERFGKFWGAFSVVDLFILNALTIVTEFIGITFVLDFFGIPKVAGVCIAAAVTMAAVSTGNFRRFERFAVVLCLLSLLLVPVLVSIHPPVSQMAHDFFIPNWPAHSKLSDVMLLVIGIVGTTVAPWQLFFQQSYIVDKRITPRFMKYEKADLWIGIVFVMIGAVAMISFCAALYAGKPEFGNFTDAGGVLAGLERYAGRTPAVLFAIALLDACIIGAAAVSLSTAYAIGDVFKIRHSLHRGVSDAKGFYLVYFGIIAAAATLVLIPGSPLGLLTEAVQTLAGVLLPSATVFLLLLCNDRAVLGPWVNSKKLNFFTGAVVWVLVMLSIILTASVMYPDITGETIIEVLAGGTLMAAVGYAATLVVRKRRLDSANGMARETEPTYAKGARDTWRMPPLEDLPAPQLTMSKRVWMGVLRGYLIAAVALVIVKVVQMTLLH